MCQYALSLMISSFIQILTRSLKIDAFSLWQKLKYLLNPLALIIRFETFSHLIQDIILLGGQCVISDFIRKNNLFFNFRS